MKIHFSASIHGQGQFRAHQERITDLIRKHGHKVFDQDTLGISHDDVKEFTDQDHLDFYSRNYNNLKKADALFVELSYTSTSTGYMIALAVNQSKPVVIFYSGQEEPHLFNTLEKVNERVMVVRYQEIADLDKEVPRALDFVANAQDVRFNFFVSPGITNYLNWISKNRKIPRSVFLRKLIDESIDEDIEYQEALT